MLVEFRVSDIDALSPLYNDFLDHAKKEALQSFTESIKRSIKKSSRYYKPVHMLGGKAVINGSVGENSFGSNISLEYKYLFNPVLLEDREEIVKNAYVRSKRKQSHISPIDRLIRAALPINVSDAKGIGDSGVPSEIFEAIKDTEKVRNELCLLVGSVGSGKSTFSDYLSVVALPEELRKSTEWLGVNLNEAPISRGHIYKWVAQECMQKIRKSRPEIDFDHIDTLRNIYSKQLKALEKGRASLYPVDSEKYADIIFDELEKLQNDQEITLDSLINYLYCGRGILLVLVLDNCDKRTREDQLLMFEVASWLKRRFSCMIFLPIRDTTYDQYCDEPPLDTVIKDLVFRIDPPLLERVVYERLNFAVRDINSNDKTFSYYLPNNMRVECHREEVSVYLRTIIQSLFQNQLFKRIITGLAGRNIRKGLEIILDFCKSGHITEDHILKIRQSKGDYALPPFLIARILLKGKRMNYSDEHSPIKNLFASDDNDALPDPFVRIAILNWLKKRHREYGPSRIKGYHKVKELMRSLIANGHSESRILSEVNVLKEAECISGETQEKEVSSEDLISIMPAGIVHLELLKHMSYLSTVSEDTLFRENQPAKRIADNMSGRGKFKKFSKQAEIDSSLALMEYMDSYCSDYLSSAVSLLRDESFEDLVDTSAILEYVNYKAANDAELQKATKRENDYPVGSEVEAQVVSIQPYGIFVEFGLEGTGLIHKSKFNNLDKDSIENCEEGDWIIARILKYNLKHKRYDMKLIDL